MKIYVKDLGDKRKDLFKTQHEGFQELESVFFWVLFHKEELIKKLL